MISKAQVKYIRSLWQQKYRNIENCYLVEGVKLANEWLKSCQKIKMIAATPEWLNEHNELCQTHPEATIITIDAAELAQISTLKTPNQVLLIVHNAIPTPIEKRAHKWMVALENIQDPGNMGTLIRTADWFGIPTLIASENSVDFYNPKVVQAAMGGHLRVRLYQLDLKSYLSTTTLPIYAATLAGKSITDSQPKADAGILLMGNESKGLTKEILDTATHLIRIPGKGGAESLNVAVAMGILAAHLTL